MSEYDKAEMAMLLMEFFNDEHYLRTEMREAISYSELYRAEHGSVEWREKVYQIACAFDKELQETIKSAQFFRPDGDWYEYLNGMCWDYEFIPLVIQRLEEYCSATSRDWLDATELDINIAFQWALLGVDPSEYRGNNDYMEA